MTALPRQAVMLPRSIAKARHALSLWKVMLGASGARWRLLAIFGLTAILLGMLAICLAPVAWQSRPERNLELAKMLGDAPRPGVLPGSPENTLNPMDDQPLALQGEEAVVQNARARYAALGPAALPYRFAGPSSDRLNARACLAAAMVYEAGDDAIGQLAVGQVVLNRVRHPAFPASVCGVVAQGSDRATGCQFTFTCDGSLTRSVAPAVRARALAHADLMLDGVVFSGVGLATHYHTSRVYPWWSPRLEKIARVGSHLFLRWPGFWGSSRVFTARRKNVEPSAALFKQFVTAPVNAELAAGDGETVVAHPRNDGAAADGKKPQPLAGGISTVTVDTERTVMIPLSRRLPGIDLAEGGRPTLLPSAPALKGIRLIRMFPDEGVFFFQLLPGSTVSDRKHAAEQLCGGRSDCQVFGWWSAAAAPATMRLEPSARAAAAFAFSRHPDPAGRARAPSAITM